MATTRVKVGQKVLIPQGAFVVKGVVIEDRGDIGRGGRQIIAVRLPPASEWEESRVIEVGAEDVKLSK
jgi:hypothetical protein